MCGIRACTLLSYISYACFRKEDVHTFLIVICMKIRAVIIY